MGFLDSVKAWFSQEAAEASDAKRDLEQRWNSDLDRKERELTATPAERMEMLQDDIASNDSAFDDLRSKLEGRQAHADAVSDVDDLSNPDPGTVTAADGQGMGDVASEREEDTDIEDAVIVELDETKPDSGP